MAANGSYLREQAHRCVQLARDCPDQKTSHELEAIGIELMEKAAELDELLAIRPASANGTSGNGETE
jgi:hypothetical protein